MSSKINFFFFGFGQTAKYFVKELINSRIKFIFSTTNTKKTRSLYFSKKKFNSFKFKDNIFDIKLIRTLKNSDYILVSIPPKKNKDLVVKKFNKVLRELKFKKLIYLSATSVYGNHNGKWVNEKSKLKGKSKYGLGRKMVEKSWISLRNSTNLDINILRVSGIYSKENNVLKKILKSKIFVKEKKYFSRIRIEDLATIIKKMFFSSKKNMILNASDDQPATNLEVVHYASRLLNVKNLQAVPISKFKNKTIKEFYKDSKRVSNKKMKKTLKIKLKYPTYKQGLRNIFNNPG